ncbi:MAG: hypothetical protein QF815_03530 [Candidatus Peribacteraceae bacterium]|nr:hypothetical protein [Candidatus Peribacteraceae bacterium]
MKRFSSLLAGLVCVAALAVPQSTYAFSWGDWLNPYRGLDATRYPGFECKLRNSWGDCVVFSYITSNKPNKQKVYGRKIFSSYGLNFSECQYDNYLQDSAPRTNYKICDYGEPQH